MKKKKAKKGTKPPAVVVRLAELVPTADLVANPDNPRDVAAAVDDVMASIEEFGFNQPIVVGDGGTVVAGHVRLEAARRLKMKEVPVVRLKDLPEKLQRRYALADNKTGELAGWDPGKLYGWLDALKREDGIRKLPGFTQAEVESALQAGQKPARKVKAPAEAAPMVVVTFVFTPDQYAKKKRAIEKAAQSLGVTPTVQEA